MTQADSTPHERQHTATKASDKVPVRQKIAYGLGTTNDMWGNWLYPGMAWAVFNQFLLVNPKFIGMALMFNRVFDAVSDPFFGWVSDNTRTRFGRRRPYILIGSILSGLSLPMLFMVSPGWSEWGYFGFMVATSCIFITIVSCFNMPYQSLGAELTPDFHERTSVFSYKSGIQKIPEVALFTSGAFVTSTIWLNATAGSIPERLRQMWELTSEWGMSMFSSLITLDFGALTELFKQPFGWPVYVPGDPLPNIILGARVLTTGLGAIMILVGFVVFFGVKERYYQTLITRKQEKIRITETLYQTLQCRPFRAQLAMGFAYQMGASMVGVLGLYTTIYYVCEGNVPMGNIWNFGMGLSNMVIGFMGIPVFNFISRRAGKRHGMAAVQLSAIAIFIATWWLYDPDIKWLQIFASGGIAFTGAGFWMLYGSIGADVIDYDELENGKRREGAFSACGSWIMKMGMAVGIGGSGFILDWTGFDAAKGADQLPSAIFWVRFLLAALPVVGLTVAFVFLKRFGLTQDEMYEIRRKLEERRGEI